jgi:D-alanyl-D-alanine endopeptidase (penicillin-binding protein 7)
VPAGNSWAPGGSRQQLRPPSAAPEFAPRRGQPIYSKGADAVTAIASVTKLMTAMVVLDAQQPMDEALTIDIGDLDLLKASSSRLRLGSTMTRREMLQLALMSSENRAASCLARNYPGGTQAFVEAMNRKASLGMLQTHFNDATGLSAKTSRPRDLARMVQAAAGYPLIREFTTTASHSVEIGPSGRVLASTIPTRWCAAGSGTSRSARPGSFGKPANAW